MEKQEIEEYILSKIIALESEDTKMQELAELLIRYINKFSVICLKVFDIKILKAIDTNENIKKLYQNCLYIALVVLSPVNASLQQFKKKIKGKIQQEELVIDPIDQARNTRIIGKIERKVLQEKYPKGPLSLHFSSTFFNE